MTKTALKIKDPTYFWNVCDFLISHGNVTRGAVGLLRVGNLPPYWFRPIDEYHYLGLYHKGRLQLVARLETIVHEPDRKMSRCQYKNSKVPYQDYPKSWGASCKDSLEQDYWRMVDFRQHGHTFLEMQVGMLDINAVNMTLPDAIGVSHISQQAVSPLKMDRFFEEEESDYPSNQDPWYFPPELDEIRRRNQVELNMDGTPRDEYRILR